MPGALIKRHQRRVKTAIWRVGENVTIERPDGSETENIYGKKDDTDITWNTVSTDEYATRRYDLIEDFPRSANVTGGQVDTDEPLIVMAHDTAAKEGDRLVFPDGNTYYIERIHQLGTHTRVEDNTLDTT